MAKEIVVTATGVTVKEILGKNPDGTDAVRQWDCPPDQAEKHLSTWNDETVVKLSTGDAAPTKLSKGEVSAIQDAANEYRKQVKS